MKKEGGGGRGGLDGCVDVKHLERENEGVGREGGERRE